MDNRNYIDEEVEKIKYKFFGPYKDALPDPQYNFRIFPQNNAPMEVVNEHFYFVKLQNADDIYLFVEKLRPRDDVNERNYYVDNMMDLVDINRNKELWIGITPAAGDH